MQKTDTKYNVRVGFFNQPLPKLTALFLQNESGHRIPEPGPLSSPSILFLLSQISHYDSPPVLQRDPHPESWELFFLSLLSIIVLIRNLGSISPSHGSPSHLLSGIFEAFRLSCLSIIALMRDFRSILPPTPLHPSSYSGSTELFLLQRLSILSIFFSSSA